MLTFGSIVARKVVLVLEGETTLAVVLDAGDGIDALITDLPPGRSSVDALSAS